MGPLTIEVVAASDSIACRWITWASLSSLNGRGWAWSHWELMYQHGQVSHKGALPFYEKRRREKGRVDHEGGTRLSLTRTQRLAL